MPKLRSCRGIDSVSRHLIQAREFGSFTLVEAHQRLPVVKRITRESERKLKPLQQRLHAMVPADPRQQNIRYQYRQIVEQWAGKIERLGLKAQGLWQVGFDGGEGWYCWQFPDRRIRYFLEYGDEFSQRRLIRERLPYDHLDLAHEL